MGKKFTSLSILRQKKSVTSWPRTVFGGVLHLCNLLKLTNSTCCFFVAKAFIVPELVSPFFGRFFFFEDGVKFDQMPLGVLAGNLLLNRRKTQNFLIGP